MNNSWFKSITEKQVSFGALYLWFLLAVLLVCTGLYAKPQIVGPKIYGVYPNTPFLFPLGALNTGDDRTFTALSNLPNGLTLDSKTGFRNIDTVLNFSNYTHGEYSNPTDFILDKADRSAIDAGVPTEIFSTDYNDVIRPQGEAWDVGAYEFSQ